MNSYVDALPDAVFEQTPKAVFAAIAIDILSRGGQDVDQATKAVIRIWRQLHSDGIVPQSVPPAIMDFLKD